MTVSVVDLQLNLSSAQLMFEKITKHKLSELMNLILKFMTLCK